MDGYTEPYLVFEDPDGGGPIALTDGDSDTNSLFTASVTGDTARLSAKNAGTTTAWLVVYDGLYFATSNTFNYTITGTLGSGAGSYAENLLAFLPDADDISTSFQLVIVIGAILFTLIMALIISQSYSTAGAGGRSVFLYGIGALIILEIVFFTFISYIPLWLTILLFIAVTILGIGRARSAMVGPGGA
jgi:hypothetical protein